MQMIHGKEFDAVNYDFEALRSALISHIEDLIQKVPVDHRELYKVFVRPSIDYIRSCPGYGLLIVADGEGIDIEQFRM